MCLRSCRSVRSPKPSPRPRRPRRLAHPQQRMAVPLGCGSSSGWRSLADWSGTSDIGGDKPQLLVRSTLCFIPSRNVREPHARAAVEVSTFIPSCRRVAARQDALGVLHLPDREESDGTRPIGIGKEQPGLAPADLLEIDRRLQGYEVWTEAELAAERACSCGSSCPGSDANACETRGERGQAGESSPAVGRKGPELILDSVNGNLSNSGVQGHGNAPPSPPRTAGRCPPRPSDDERKNA